MLFCRVSFRFISFLQFLFLSTQQVCTFNCLKNQKKLNKSLLFLKKLSTLQFFQHNAINLNVKLLSNWCEFKRNLYKSSQDICKLQTTLIKPINIKTLIAFDKAWVSNLSLVMWTLKSVWLHARITMWRNRSTLKWKSQPALLYRVPS